MAPSPPVPGICVGCAGHAGVGGGPDDPALTAQPPPPHSSERGGRRRRGEGGADNGPGRRRQCPQPEPGRGGAADWAAGAGSGGAPLPAFMLVVPPSARADEVSPNPGDGRWGGAGDHPGAQQGAQMGEGCPPTHPTGFRRGGSVIDPIEAAGPLRPASPRIKGGGSTVGPAPQIPPPTSGWDPELVRWGTHRASSLTPPAVPRVPT